MLDLVQYIYESEIYREHKYEVYVFDLGDCNYQTKRNELETIAITIIL